MLTQPGIPNEYTLSTSCYGARLKTIEDQAVNEAIALQLRAGMDVISDGEMRRYAFFGHLIEAVEGFDKFGGWAMRFRDERGDELLYRRPLVISHLRRRRHLCAEEFTYLRARIIGRRAVTPEECAYYYGDLADTFCDKEK